MMQIAAVVVTYARVALLRRCLQSIAKQSRRPDFIYVISNSTCAIFRQEQKLCAELGLVRPGFSVSKNCRTKNYAGALNTAVEKIVQQHGYGDELYFAALDDDDEWLPNYLSEVERNNDRDYELLAANYLRLSASENSLMTLPPSLSPLDFLRGNPGINGSNAVVRLNTLLRAGCFDEALPSAVDRDVWIRLLQQAPSYNFIQQHLVTAHTDQDRPRITTDLAKKQRGFQVFYYKYQGLMDAAVKEKFLARAKNLFSLSREHIEIQATAAPAPARQNILFNAKGDYQFVIGFIAGDEHFAEQLVKQIIDLHIAVDLVVIIDNTASGQPLDACRAVLQAKQLPFAIIDTATWQRNLARGHYGEYFKKFTALNSIPLGRTILHHHLFMATREFAKPVYWIIDDDVSLDTTTAAGSRAFDLFELINQNLAKTEVIVGAISKDPPVPTLCCLRVQLLDFLYSDQAGQRAIPDGLNLRHKPDYYYDLSDTHSDHIEVPLYHTAVNANSLRQIFAGKSLSRPAFARHPKLTPDKIIGRRGGNTLVFNRQVLQYYPVISLEVNNQFTRRGDLLWALFNQVISGRSMHEHTFALNHNRPQGDFDLAKELDKAARDLIGYALNKALLKTIATIQRETHPYRPKDILEKLGQTRYYATFSATYTDYLQRRRARFLMNYFRIVGLTKLLSSKYRLAKHYFDQLADTSRLSAFEKTVHDSQTSATLESFLRNLTPMIWSYDNSITASYGPKDVAEYNEQLQRYFGLRKALQTLGRGNEGVVYADARYVYKVFYNILDREWNFLNKKAPCFAASPLLERIECFESAGLRFIRYPFYDFTAVSTFAPAALIAFLKFCKQHDLVYTNLKPQNFIQTQSGIRLVDYGKSFEPFTEEKFLNSSKRAYLLLTYPQMATQPFQELTASINRGEVPTEIENWQHLYRAVAPRTRQQILDADIVARITAGNYCRILDYGAGKCKIARQLQQTMATDIYVYDIEPNILRQYCHGFPLYQPANALFTNYFELALLNLVLCEVEHKTAMAILANISTALVENGVLIVAVCNPEFAHVRKTEFQCRATLAHANLNEQVLTKTCIYTGKPKTEFHRPTQKYLELFAASGFTLDAIIDTDGTDIETLRYASDFKIFILKKC